MKLELTAGGIEFLLNSMTGGPSPQFCKITLGNGDDAGKQANELSNPIKDIEITDMYQEGNFVTLLCMMNNSEIRERFKATELGVYITDPDAENENGVILFAYGHVDEKEATVIPAAQDYVFETAMKVMVYVGATENVTAILNESLIVATKEELHEHTEDCENPHRVTAEMIGAASAEKKKTGQYVNITDAAHASLKGLKLYGKTTQEGTPTPDTPVELASAGTGGSIGVTITGKNLLNFCPNIAGYKNRGITFDAQEGGTRLYGTSSDGYAQNKAEHYMSINVPSGTYTLRMEVAGETAGARFCVRIVRDGATVGSASGTVSGSATLALEEGVNYGCFVYMEESGKTVDCVIRVMLAPREESTQWEAYTAQTLTVPTPNGLPGIPVTSDGNYADANGQQWLAHVAGYVQDGQIGEWVTTGYIESYAGELIPGAYLSSTGGLDAGASVRYALETPVFMPYDADVQAQWRALHTNKPNTTIYNDAGAHMEITYYTPNSAVQMFHNPADKDKILTIDEHGCVALVEHPYSYTYQDTDLTAGTSALETGKMCLVYE